jgi:hypothetical protein
MAYAMLPQHACSQIAKPVTDVPVSIIIDDMGYNYTLGKQALNLSGEITYSFLPNTPYGKQLAQLAFKNKRKVMLHLPLQGHHHKHIEPDSLNSNMSEQEFRTKLRRHLSAIPHISGVNNHMGSKVTTLVPQMDWLMQELDIHNLFFIDSRTTHLTVAEESAIANNVPFARRDIFLDNEKSIDSIKKSFERLIKLAHLRGGAIAIAHPHPVTLKVLGELLPTLKNRKLKLVYADKLLNKQGLIATEKLVARDNILPKN